MAMFNSYLYVYQAGYPNWLKVFTPLIYWAAQVSLSLWGPELQHHPAWVSLEHQPKNGEIVVEQPLKNGRRCTQKLWI